MPGKRGSDRRVTKTRRAIRRAFAKLSAEKNVNDITILELAREADINRKTFYNHYSGIYAVVEEIEDEVCSQLGRLLEGFHQEQLVDNTEEIFRQLTQAINGYMDLYGSLILDNQRLISKMAVMLAERTRPALVERYQLAEPAADLMLSYCLGGIYHLYRDWYLAGRVRSPEEISRLVGVLCRQGIQGVLSHPGDWT